MIRLSGSVMFARRSVSGAACTASRAAASLAWAAWSASCGCLVDPQAWADGLLSLDRRGRPALTLGL
jgi:hypothetical protein